MHENRRYRYLIVACLLALPSGGETRPAVKVQESGVALNATSYECRAFAYNSPEVGEPKTTYFKAELTTTWSDGSTSKKVLSMSAVGREKDLPQKRKEAVEACVDFLNRHPLN